MYSVRKKFKLDYAHRLHLMPAGHKCRNLHGHTGIFEVKIQVQELDEIGFVSDFGELKGIKKWIDEHLDHATIQASTDTNLQKVTQVLKTKTYTMPLDYPQTTSECLCHLLQEKITNEIMPEFFKDRLGWVYVAFYETSDNCAEFDKPLEK